MQRELRRFTDCTAKYQYSGGCEPSACELSCFYCGKYFTEVESFCESINYQYPVKNRTSADSVDNECFFHCVLGTRIFVPEPINIYELNPTSSRRCTSLTNCLWVQYPAWRRWRFPDMQNTYYTSHRFHVFGWKQMWQRAYKAHNNKHGSREAVYYNAEVNFNRPEKRCIF